MPTLEDWLRRGGRTWPEVARVLAVAGRAVAEDGPFVLRAVQVDDAGHARGPLSGDLTSFRAAVLESLGGPSGPAPSGLVAALNSGDSVSALCALLEGAEAHRRRRRAVSLGLTAVLAMVCVGLLGVVLGRDPRCRSAAASPYPAREAAELATSFTAAHGPGRTSFAAFDRAVKGFVTAHRSTTAEVCQTDDPSRGLACLDVRRQQLVQVLALAHQGPPLAAAASLSILPSPSTCRTATAAPATSEIDAWLGWARAPAGAPPSTGLPGAREASGLVALAHGRPRQALTRWAPALARAREGGSAPVRLLANAGRAYLLAGDYAQAAFHYDEARRARSGATPDPNLELASSVAMILAGDPNAALARITALGEDRSLDARRAEAFAHEREGRLELALTTIDASIERFEGIVGAENVAIADLHLQRGWLLQSLGRHGPAVAAHRRALELLERRLGVHHPATYRATVGLAAAELETDLAEVAVERLEAAIAAEAEVTIADRDRAEARFVLARSMFSEGQRRRAESHAAAARAFVLRDTRPYPSLVAAIEKLRARLRAPL